MRKPLSIIFIVFLLAPMCLGAEISRTEPYDYNYSHADDISFESSWDYALLFIILVLLVLILYKGETTFEHLKRIHKKRKSSGEKLRKETRRARKK